MGFTSFSILKLWDYRDRQRAGFGWEWLSVCAGSYRRAS